MVHATRINGADSSIVSDSAMVLLLLLPVLAVFISAMREIKISSSFGQESQNILTLVELK